MYLVKLGSYKHTFTDTFERHSVAAAQYRDLFNSNHVEILLALTYKNHRIRESFREHRLQSTDKLGFETQQKLVKQADSI